MFDTAADGKFTPEEFRNSFENPPVIVYRIPTALETVLHSTRAAALRDEMGFQPDQILEWYMHEQTLRWFAEQARTYILEVKNIARSGEMIDWRKLDYDGQVSLLMSLGTCAQTRLWALIELAGDIFTGFSAVQKKTSSGSSSSDTDSKTTDATAKRAAVTVTSNC